MALSDTAEYWQDVKASFGRTKHKFTHVPNFDCGHFHIRDAQYINEVDCYACKKALEEGLEHSLKSEQQFKDKIENRRQQKANKQKKKAIKKLPNNPICSCGFVMIKRSNSTSHAKFWGCSQYPICKQTKSI